MTTTNTEVSTKAPGALMAVPTNWGTDQITTDQIEITRIKLMQATSDAVKKEEHKAGELVNKTTGAVEGGRGKPIEVIIFNKACYWMVYEKDQAGKSAFKEIIPMTSGNSGLLKVEGMLKRIPVWEFYCLQESDPSSIPWIVSFNGASFKHAKKLLSVIKNSKGSMGSNTYLLDTVVETWDGNSYYVYSAKQGKKTTPEQELAAYNWFVDTEKSKHATVPAAAEDLEAAPF